MSGGRARATESSLTVALAVACLLLVGCRSSTPSPPTDHGSTPQGRLNLDGAWRDAKVPGDARPGAVAFEARFSLEEDQRGEASHLVFGDPWWKVRVAVNGSPAGEVGGGLGSVSLAVGQHLIAGENRISVVVSPPPRAGPTAIPRLRTNGDRRDVSLGPNVGLELRPEGHLVDVALRASGDEVAVVARVAGAPRGARVSALAILDGKTVQDLGSTEVTGETVVLPSVRWEGERWSPLAQRDGSLFHVTAQLEEQDGTALHRISRRTGVRTMTVGEAGFSLNGEPFPLLADRIQTGVAPHSQLAEVSTAGLNALEAHGHLPREDWLDEADELGLPVVVLPRCVGAIWGGGAADRWAELETWKEELAAQDTSAAWAMAGHPSVVLWACEGTPNVAGRMCEGIADADAADTPVAGLDMASRSIGSTGQARTDRAGNRDDAPAWIVEIGKVEGAHGIRDIAQHFAESSGGLYGGVALPAPPRIEDVEEWRSSWNDVADSMGVKSPVASDRRARSRLRVTGLSPGQTIWVEVPGLAPVGTVASERGVAVLDLWHEGECTVRAGGESYPVTLEPDRWKHLKRESNQVQLNLPP